MEEFQASATYTAASMPMPLSFSSSALSTSYLSSFDVAVFCVVLLLSLSMGIIHTYLITRQCGQNLSSPQETAHQYDTIHSKTHRGSDATSEGNPSRRNSTLDTEGVDKERKSSMETNGIDRQYRENQHDDYANSNNKKFRSGFALIPTFENGEYSVGIIDIMFQLVCFSSVILTIGLPMYSYLHGPSLAISILPAMLAAHVASVGIVIPFIKRYHHKSVKRNSVKQKEDGEISKDNLFFLRYLQARFGGTQYTKHHKDIQHIEISNKFSAHNSSYRVLLILTWILIITFWGFVTVCISLYHDLLFLKLTIILQCIC